MEYIKKFEKRIGVDVFYGNKYNLHPENGDGRVGKSGIDKSFTLERVIALAYQMAEKPNIIIKSGLNGKWYLKRCPANDIEGEIEKQQDWRDVSRSTMYIIVWDD
jgi:hypothetical protein